MVGARGGLPRLLSGRHFLVCSRPQCLPGGG
jgi:hypothetical protein